MPEPRTLRLNGEDNVASPSTQVPQGATRGRHHARQQRPQGTQDGRDADPRGRADQQFSQIIGFAKSHIAPGEWVHEHNVGLHEFERDYRFAEDARDDDLLPRNCAPPSRAIAAIRAKRARATISASSPP
jgi:altronate hydrolase